MSAQPRDFGLDHEPPASSLNIADIWHRRKWTGIAVAVATWAAALAIAVALPSLYTSSATVLVEREMSEEFVKQSVTSELETRIRSIHQQVTSREHLSQMIKNLNLYPDMRDTVPFEEVVAHMRRDINLQLQAVQQTTGATATIAFTLGYTGRDPETVAKVTNAIVQTYVSANATNREKQAATTAEFLKKQLDEVKRDLDLKEGQTRSFAQTYTAELPEQLTVNLSTVQRLQSQLSANTEQQARLSERRERLEQEIATAPATPAAAPPPDPNSPAGRLAALRAQRDTLKRSFSDEYPDVKRLNAEIALVESQVAQSAPASRTSAPPPNAADQRRATLQSIDQELRSLEREAGDLRANIARHEALAGRAPRRQMELEQLSRARDQSRARYEALLQQYEDARLASTIEEDRGAEQFRVLDAAVAPELPIAPNRPLLAGMGLLGAIVLGVAAIMLREKLDTTLHTPDDLRKLIAGPPVIAIRRIATRRARRVEQMRAALATVGVILLIGLIAGSAYHLAQGNEQIVRLTARGGTT